MSPLYKLCMQHTGRCLCKYKLICINVCRLFVGGVYANTFFPIWSLWNEIWQKRANMVDRHWESWERRESFWKADAGRSASSLFPSFVFRVACVFPRVDGSEIVGNALGKLLNCAVFWSEAEGERRRRVPPVLSRPVPSRRRYAVAQRLQAERELGAAAARRLGGSPGLRWPSVLHRPQHPANFMDRPERQVECDNAEFLHVYAPSWEKGVSSHPLEELEGWRRLQQAARDSKFT